MRSLGARLTYWYALVVSVTVISSLCVVRWLVERELIRGMDLLNTAEYQEILDRVESLPHQHSETETIQRIDAHSKIDAPLYFFQVSDPTGKVVFRSANMGESTLPSAPPGERSWSATVPLLEDVRIGQFKLDGHTLEIAASLRDAHRLLRGYFSVSLVILGLAAALSVLIGYRLSRLALDPVRRIQITAQRISAENLSERIPVDASKDEIADLARLLNQMFARLEVSFGRLWRFSAEASHELKTPLSLIRLQSEKLLMGGGLMPAQYEAVQQQMESISRLDSVIEKLLFLAKSEVGAVKLNLRSQDTRQLLTSVADDLRALCEDAGLEFELREVAGAETRFDPILIRQVLLNLVSNALRATPAGGKIVLNSAVTANAWRVSVEDTGPGIPSSRLEDIFEPFTQYSGSEQPEHGNGAGLGLAICRGIIELHRGRIFAENRSPGLRVVFEIPILTSEHVR